MSDQTQTGTKLPEFPAAAKPAGQPATAAKAGKNTDGKAAAAAEEGKPVRRKSTRQTHKNGGDDQEKLAAIQALAAARRYVLTVTDGDGGTCVFVNWS